MRDSLRLAEDHTRIHVPTGAHSFVLSVVAPHRAGDRDDRDDTPPGTRTTDEKLKIRYLLEMHQIQMDNDGEHDGGETRVNSCTEGVIRAELTPHAPNHLHPYHSHFPSIRAPSMIQAT